MRQPPYVADNETGTSNTRKFLEMFLEAYFSPTDVQRSINDTIFGATVVPQESLYTQPAPHARVQQYIGRAARVASSNGNKHEYLWCLQADISSALKQLPPLTRQIMAYRYIFDYSDHTIADITHKSETAVRALIDAGLNQATMILDGVPNASQASI